jgi:hypothetical protein
MPLEARWAKYACAQSAAELSDSIAQSDADDVRLDCIVEGIAHDAGEEAVVVERAVRSNARKERSRKQARTLTEHALRPSSIPSPEQALIWRQSWTQFEQAVSTSELHLLIQGDIELRTVPMTGAERTRLSRIKSSTGFEAVRVAAFG